MPGQNSLCEPGPQIAPPSSSRCLGPAHFVHRGLAADSDCIPFPDGQVCDKPPSREVRGGRGPVCPTISTKGQSSPQPRVAETRRGQSPNHVGRKGATISTNEAGGLKAFYFEAARPPREQTVLLLWLPGTPGRKEFGDRRRGGGLEKTWREKERGRAKDGSRRGWCWLGGFLSSIPPKKTKTKPRTLDLHPPLPHSGHWPITPFNAFDPSSWKQSKQHAL